MVEVGEKVTRVKVGDRVAIEPILSPNKDGAYQMERYNLTPLLGFHGLSGGGGGFSEFTVMGEHMVHKLPDDLSYEQGRWSSLRRSRCIQYARAASKPGIVPWCLVRGRLV
ncbi:hypothetical protein HAALTHF_41770n [Vreelandella aquamarina]|nr:hypothetical protein HAALTHF_41770n [Halomonas axialensis]